MLTQERLKELLDYDPLTGIFSWRIGRPGPRARVGARAGCPNDKGYIQIYVDGRSYKAHRLAYLYTYGTMPPKDIDHAGRVKSDNRIQNLRPATRSENIQNTDDRRNNTSGCKGVHWHSRDKKWAAQITLDYEIKHLGYFDNIFDAVCARKTAEIQYHPFRPQA